MTLRIDDKETIIAETNEAMKLIMGVLIFKKAEFFLLVEGKTDADFFKNCISKNGSCTSVSDLLRNRDPFRKESSVIADRQNNKRVICNTVYGQEQLPQLITPPRGFTAVVFGVVDKDFDFDFDDYRMATRLFQTDAHDLETMMIEKDEDAFNRIDGISISAGELLEAEALAYEIALMYKGIRDYAHQPIKFLKQRGLDYSKLVTGKDIDIAKTISFLNEQLSEADRRSHNALQQKEVVNSISRDNWKIVEKDIFTLNNKGDFETWQYPTLWDDINGHDLLDAIAFVSKSVQQKYSRGNTRFETDLIDKYDYKKLSRTKLFQRMNTAGLLDIQ